jgi:transposase
MAKFNSAWLLRKRPFRSLTGVDAGAFLTMVKRLRPHWRKRVVDPKNRDGRPWGIGGLEEHLLVLLILYRCGVTQDFLACLYQTDQAAISRSLQRIERLAVKALGVKRQIRVSREEAEALIVDCTEQPIQRPSRKQRCWYSGKKKGHRIKTEIIVTAQGRIVSRSNPATGRTSDITVRRRGPPLPKGARVYADSGYQGLQDDHPDVEIPYKKSKHHPLARDEKEYNRGLSRFRVRVEHAIAKLKSFRMLSERYRYPRATYAVKFAIIAGVVNLLAGF